MDDQDRVEATAAATVVATRRRRQRPDDEADSEPFRTFGRREAAEQAYGAPISSPSSIKRSGLATATFNDAYFPFGNAILASLLARLPHMSTEPFESVRSMSLALLVSSRHGLGYHDKVGALRLDGRRDDDSSAASWRHRRRRARRSEDREPGLSFEVVESSSTSSSTLSQGSTVGLLAKRRGRELAQALLQRDEIGSTARWSDGVAMPTGFVFAVRHDPRHLIRSRERKTTYVDESVDPIHSPGANFQSPAPIPTQPAVVSTAIATLTQLPQFPSLATRFVASSSALAGSASPKASFTKSREFARTTGLAWTPNDLIRARFGVPKPAPVDNDTSLESSVILVSSQNDEKAIAKSAELRASIFNRPTGVAPEPVFVDSDSGADDDGGRRKSRSKRVRMRILPAMES